MYQRKSTETNWHAHWCYYYYYDLMMMMMMLVMTLMKMIMNALGFQRNCLDVYMKMLEFGPKFTKY